MDSEKAEAPFESHVVVEANSNEAQEQPSGNAFAHASSLPSCAQEVSIGNTKVQFFKAEDLLSQSIITKLKINPQSLASLQSGKGFIKDFRQNFNFGQGDDDDDTRLRDASDPSN